MPKSATGLPPQASIRGAEIPLSRDTFLRSLLGHLSEALQDTIGLEDAAGFVSVVGHRLGEEIESSYKTALALETLSRQQVAEVLVDLKRRIQGDFYVIEEDDEKIVLANRACPFGDRVIGRSALCMMTSNVFGSITANNLGYARVELEETIAEGHDGCRVVVYLKPGVGAGPREGREYFRS